MTKNIFWKSDWLKTDKSTSFVSKLMMGFNEKEFSFSSQAYFGTISFGYFIG